MSVIDSNKFNISIHALREESDKWQYSRKIIKRHFNPRSPWGERLVFLLYKPIGLGFQSTLSVRRATAITILTIIINPNFNPRSPWGERLNELFDGDTTYVISIHALREESDSITLFISIITAVISIHALREESDITRPIRFTKAFRFQSTLSVRRATLQKGDINLII